MRRAPPVTRITRSVMSISRPWTQSLSAAHLIAGGLADPAKQRSARDSEIPYALLPPALHLVDPAVGHRVRSQLGTPPDPMPV